VSRVTVTPESLARHELAGLSVRVADATDPTLVDRSGRVVDETTNTLLVAEQRPEREREHCATTEQRIQVPKAGCALEFELPDGPVTVAGDRLVARPARRTERGNRWQ